MSDTSRTPQAFPRWLGALGLLLMMFAIVRVDGMRQNAFPDIVAVRCAGQALNAGLNPYNSVREVCGPNTLDFFYPPVIARLAAATVAWCGVPHWMAIFHVAYAAAFTALILVAVRLLMRAYNSPAAVLVALGLILALGGGVVVTGFQSGNIAVLLWTVLALAIFALRSARLAAAVILVGACVKIYLLYWLVIPALMRRELRLVLLVGGGVVLAYVAQWYFEPALFSSYSHEVAQLSQTPGYAGASSMQLGVWIAALTGLQAMRVIVAALVFGALTWRSRHLVGSLLRGVDSDSTRLRLLALLVLVLAVLSPRVTHYDLLIVLPAVAVLAALPSQQGALITGCVALPWLCRGALLAARFEPLKSLAQAKYGLDYSALWELYLFATWALLTGYAWRALGRSSVAAVISAGSPAASPQVSGAHCAISPPT
jgi:hypothetical protein